MQQKHIALDQIEIFVLDEADRMLDMGFIHDIKKVVQRLPRKRHTLFFSATMSPEVTKLAQSMLHDPVRVEVTPQATVVDKIEQRVFFVDKNQTQELLLHLLEEEHLEKVLVFTRTKHFANKLAKKLNAAGVTADAIHGNKSQTARTQALRGFRNGKVRVLVATDIAARGIDIPDISHVINYELPNEPESYVHRIGRTARAGLEGTAYAFCSAEERKFLKDIERLIKHRITVVEHKYHSEAAKNSKATPKQFGRGRRKPRKPKHSRGKSRGRGKPRGGGKKSFYKRRK